MDVDDGGHVERPQAPAVPAIHVRQDTGSTIEIPDSDDEERLEELAEDEESQYWDMLDVLPGMDAREQGAVQGTSSAHQQVLGQSLSVSLQQDSLDPESDAKDAGSPDPMDLLAARYEHPAMAPGTQSNQSHAPEGMDVTEDSDTELSPARLPPNASGDGVHADHFGMPAEELEHIKVNTSSFPAPARRSSLSDSDEELPSLSQAFGFSNTRRIQPTSIARSASQESDEAIHVAPSREHRAEALPVPSLSTPNSSSMKSDSSPPSNQLKSRPISPPTSVEPERIVIPEEAVGPRQFRKRTAAQLQPYTTDFLKFAENAQKHQWGDLVTKEAVYGANHRPETAEEIAARLAKLKGKKVDTHGGWLEPDSQRLPMRPDEEQRAEGSISGIRTSSEDEYEDVSPRRRASSASETRRVEKGKGRARSQDSDSDLPELAFSKHRRGELAGASTHRPRKGASSTSRKKPRSSVDGTSSASTSRITLDQPERERKRKRHADRSSGRAGDGAATKSHRQSPLTRAESEPASSPPRPARPALVRSISSSPQQPPSSKRKRKRSQGHSGGVRDPPVDFDLTGSPDRTPSNDPFRKFAGMLSQSEEEDGSQEDSDDEERVRAAPSGDSPERPDAPEDRFALKGKRKKAARAMMPAIFFRKAERDLELMREERKHGRVKDTLDRRLSGSEAEEDDNENAARARVRINKRNANKPIRFIADESTSESDGQAQEDQDSEPEQEETQLAFETWTNLAQSKNRSAEKRNAGRAGKRYWDDVIGSILIRDKLQRQAGAPKPAVRKKKRRRAKKSTITDGPTSSHNANKHVKTGPENLSHKKGSERQKRVDQYYTAPTHLDDTESLFAALPPGVTMIPPPRRKQNPFRRSDPAHPARSPQRPTSPVRRPLIDLTRPARQAHQTDEADVWSGSGSTFSRFSFDFDIKRLPPGLTFSQSSYLCRGYLHELITSATHLSDPDELRKRSAAPFGIQLDSDMGLDIFIVMLPRLCDGIYEQITSDDPPRSLTASTGEALRFSIMYMTECILPTERNKGRGSILGELEHLEARLDSWITSREANGPASVYALLVFKWYMLEIAYRDYLDHTAEAHTTEAEEARGQLLERLGELTQALVHSGLNRTMKALKTFLDLPEDEPKHLEDLTCEIWVCVIHLCSIGQADESHGILSQATLWQLVETHLNKDAEDRKLHQILRGEVASYAVMTLSCISQFSLHGLSTSTPRLSGHWSLFNRIVDSIKPQELAKGYLVMSNTGRTRSSRYLWTLYARSLLLANRWNWSLLDQSRMLGKLFDILNARELQDMSIDGEAEYPSFLADFAGGIGTEVERDDTAFRIFLRILAKVAKEAEADGSKKALDVLARISMRVMPMREKLPYSRYPKTSLVRKHRSVLVNHYSLYVLLAAVDPSNSTKRFARFKAILDFVDADSKARQECLKAIMYLGIVYKVKGLDLTPLLTWLAEIADYLRNQYLTFAKRRVALSAPLVERVTTPNPIRWNALQIQQQNKDKQPSPAERQAELARVNRDMGEVAVMMGLLLGAVQQLIMAGTDQGAEGTMPYPSLLFLQASWIKRVLESPMALDPVVGSQILNCIRCFLKLRLQAMPVKEAAPARESQDEFGDFDFDYDDPALNAMLGLEQPARASANQAEVDSKRAQDKQFAEIIKADISPAIYHLLSNINVATLGQNTGVPDIPDREGYISDLVETWTGCATVLVQNDMREWSYYMSEFGKESWHRVGDVVARYEIGLHFASGMLRNDESAYKTYRDQCLEILFRSLCASSLATALSIYLSQLLNIDTDLLLWRRLPFTTEPITNDYDISEDRLHERRIAVLRELFKNSKDIISGRFCRPPPIVIDDAEGDVQDTAEQEDLHDLMTDQNVSKPLIYRLLGNMCSSMRDHLDALKQKKEENSFKAERYARLCREIGNALKEELGVGLANERTIPQLRLLAGVMAAGGT